MIVGAVLSTVNVELGPVSAEALLALSVATPAATFMATVPSPLQLESITVRDAVPVPVTDATVHVAVSVVVRLMFDVLIFTLAMPLPPSVKFVAIDTDVLEFA